jgi:hypothetical protein
MWRRLGHFVRRWRSFILFVVIIVGGFGGFRRLENNSADTRRLAEQNTELTLQIAAQNAAQQTALCDARVASRTELKNLLLGMVDDFIPAGRPARIELERRIEDALGPPPEDCT